MDTNPIERLSFLQERGDEVIDSADPQIRHDYVCEVRRCNHAGGYGHNRAQRFTHTGETVIAVPKDQSLWGDGRSYAQRCPTENKLSQHTDSVRGS